MKITTEQIKRLRDESGAPVMRVKKVLENELGKLSKAAPVSDLKSAEKEALAILKKEGFEKAAKRLERETSQGKIFSYQHHTGKVASVVELLCETDFVARNDLFEELGKSLAMQVSSMNPKDVKDLEGQEFIKDTAKKISDLVKEVIAKTGENIKIGRIYRAEIGK